MVVYKIQKNHQKFGKKGQAQHIHPEINLELGIYVVIIQLDCYRITSPILNTNHLGISTRSLENLIAEESSL